MVLLISVIYVGEGLFLRIVFCVVYGANRNIYIVNMLLIYGDVYTIYRLMAEKSKTREITITDEGGAFNLWKRFTKTEEAYDFESLALLRRILSNERTRLLHVLKTKKPRSIYEAAKLLGRDFKSVNGDVKLLEKFGFIDVIAEKTGKRARLKPILATDSMHIHLKF